MKQLRYKIWNVKRHRYQSWWASHLWLGLQQTLQSNPNATDRRVEINMTTMPMYLRHRLQGVCASYHLDVDEEIATLILEDFAEFLASKSARYFDEDAEQATQRMLNRVSQMFEEMLDEVEGVK